MTPKIEETELNHTASVNEIDEANDLFGMNYYAVLERFHQILRPRTYFEIGVNDGKSLALSQCDSIGVDPDYKLFAPEVLEQIRQQRKTMLFRMRSDQFFDENDPGVLFGRHIDMAFLDGMHRCEFLLRDFINTERSCAKNSVVFIHDCFPVEIGMTSRVMFETRATTKHRKNWWTGDVWRFALLLKRHRPDLVMYALDANPTGLLVITNLSPNSRVLSDAYFSWSNEMLSWDLSRIGIKNYFAEMELTSATPFERAEHLTARFWL